MPKGGQNALPTRLKELRGTIRRDRMRNEPQPRRRSARVPKDLPQVAVAYWKQLAPPLARLGLLCEVDVPALSELCLCFARAREAEDVVTHEGILVQGDRGMVKNPACQIARDYATRALILCQQFGLTPASRVRIAVPEKEHSEFEDVLAGVQEFVSESS